MRHLKSSLIFFWHLLSMHCLEFLFSGDVFDFHPFFQQKRGGASHCIWHFDLNLPVCTHLHFQRYVLMILFFFGLISRAFWEGCISSSLSAYSARSISDKSEENSSLRGMWSDYACGCCSITCGSSISSTSICSAIQILLQSLGKQIMLIFLLLIRFFDNLEVMSNVNVGKRTLRNSANCPTLPNPFSALAPQTANEYHLPPLLASLISQTDKINCHQITSLPVLTFSGNPEQAVNLMRRAAEYQKQGIPQLTDHGQIVQEKEEHLQEFHSPYAVKEEDFPGMIISNRRNGEEVFEVLFHNELQDFIIHPDPQQAQNLLEARRFDFEDEHSPNNHFYISPAVGYLKNSLRFTSLDL